MLDHSIAGMVLSQHVTHCIYEKGQHSLAESVALKAPKEHLYYRKIRYTISPLFDRPKTDTIVISSRKRYIKYAFARGVRTIRSDAIVYKDGLLHRR